MTDKLESKLPDPLMQAAPRALLRAARRAREIARETKTALVVMRDGVVTAVDPDDPWLDEEDQQGEVSI